MAAIDLRSDTVTRPSAGMRSAMATAEVGDDVYGEDPSVRELEATTAELLNKPAALFVPSGTMANQLALLTQTRRGDEVVVGFGAHIAWHESGAGAAWAGVQFAVAGDGGTFSAEQAERALKPSGIPYPKSAMICLENTHNLSGGKIFPKRDIVALRNLADRRDLKLHLDGARLWHACAATGESLAEAAAPFDSISVCYSKGLGAPVGSALLGSQALIGEARRFRKMLGGGMRQAGILAAGALFALREQRQDLIEDHEKARQVAKVLREAGAKVNEPETNIVLLEIPGLAERAVELARSEGVLFHAMGPDRVRLVMHRDVDSNQANDAARRLAACLERMARSRHV